MKINEVETKFQPGDYPWLIELEISAKRSISNDWVVKDPIKVNMVEIVQKTVFNEESLVDAKEAKFITKTEITAKPNKFRDLVDFLFWIQRPIDQPEISLIAFLPKRRQVF